MHIRDFIGWLGPGRGQVFQDAEFQAREVVIPPTLETTGGIPQPNVDAVPIGDATAPYSVRSVFPVRPVNALDFNLSGYAKGSSVASITVTFNAPVGYRLVPLRWNVYVQTAASGQAGDPVNSDGLYAQLNYNGGALQFNKALIQPAPAQANALVLAEVYAADIRSFFLVEEQTSFGLTVSSDASMGDTSFAQVAVYGYALPIVAGEQLPYAIANLTGATPSS